jgi:hypothetical protein
MKNCPLVAPSFQFSRFSNLAPTPPAGGASTPGPSIHQWIFDGLFLAMLLQEVVQSGDRQGIQRRVGFGRQDPQRPPALNVHPDQQPLEGSGIGGEAGRCCSPPPRIVFAFRGTFEIAC